VGYYAEDVVGVVWLGLVVSLGSPGGVRGVWGVSGLVRGWGLGRFEWGGVDSGGC
jgi:hypothetical protein